MDRMKLPQFRLPLILAIAAIALSAPPLALAQNNNKMMMQDQEEAMEAIDEIETINKKEALEHALEQGEGKKLGIIKQLNDINDTKIDIETELSEPFRSDAVVTEAELNGETSTDADINNAVATDVEDAGLSDLVRTDAQEDSNLLEAGVTKPAQGVDNTVVNINNNPLVGFEVDDEKADALGITPDANVKETNSVLLTTPAAKTIINDVVYMPPSLVVYDINMIDNKIMLTTNKVQKTNTQSDSCAAINQTQNRKNGDNNICDSITP